MEVPLKPLFVAEKIFKMNETLKRSLSGAVYIILLLTSILYSTRSFILLFGVFLVIAAYDVHLFNYKNYTHSYLCLCHTV
jgi:hypothetical protein